MNPADCCSMYFNAVVLHLFRPFLKVDLTNSNLSPRDVCMTSANNIASLLSSYRETYTLRRSTLLITYVILSANIIDLLNLPDPKAAQNLELGTTALRECSVNHVFGGRALQVLIDLSEQWHIQLPPSTSRAAHDFLTPSHQTNGLHDPNVSTQAWPPTPSSASTYSQQQDNGYSWKSSAAEMP